MDLCVFRVGDDGTGCGFCELWLSRGLSFAMIDCFYYGFESCIRKRLCFFNDRDFISYSSSVPISLVFRNITREFEVGICLVVCSVLDSVLDHK